MANEMPEISVAELREAVSRLLDAVERRFGSAVSLGADNYWGLFSPDMFAADDSKPPVLGRTLSDDVESIRDLLLRGDRSEDEMMLWHDLNHLVGVLQRLSSLAS
jgi:hypothetical protein